MRGSDGHLPPQQIGTDSHQSEGGEVDHKDDFEGEHDDEVFDRGSLNERCSVHLWGQDEKDESDTQNQSIKEIQYEDSDQEKYAKEHNGSKIFDEEVELGINRSYYREIAQQCGQQQDKTKRKPPGHGDKHNNFKVENDFLKDCVERLYCELEQYQSLALDEAKNDINKANATLSHAKDNCHHGVQLPNWMLSSQVISPLFVAYDTRINGLVDLLERQGRELGALTDATKDLANDNERLRCKVAHFTEATVTYDCIQDRIDPENINHDREINLTEIERKCAVLMEANEYLSNQVETLTKELKSAFDEASMKDGHVQRLSQEVTDLSNDLVRFEHRITKVQREKSACEHELFETNEELGKWKRKLKVREEEIRIAKAKMVDATSRLEELMMEKMELENETQQLSAKVSYPHSNKMPRKIESIVQCRFPPT